MTASFSSFDVLLAGAVIWLAWKSVSESDTFRAIAHFVAMGLLVALAWVRLEAPDVALAEAAVGAGLTGALLMAAAFPATGRSRDGATDANPSRGATRFAGALAGGAMFAAVLSALTALPNEPAGLSGAALRHLESSGVSNPVTAALMNYRAYDTLLEVGVLLVAAVAVWSVRGVDPGSGERLEGRPIVLSLARFVVPGSVVVAGYLLWRGGFAPGGAFQGGALLGGAFVFLIVTGLVRTLSVYENALRNGLAFGTVVFVVAAAFSMLLGDEALTYRDFAAKFWILTVESAAMISIGLSLGLLYLGGRPAGSAKNADPGGEV